MRLAKLALVSLLLSGCGDRIRVVETNHRTATYSETIRINNCGGKAASEQVVERSFSANIERASELAVDYGVIEGRVSARYGEKKEVKKSHKLIAPPGTNAEIVLVWSEEAWTGNVTVNRKSGTYSVRVPLAVEQVSSRDVGCEARPPTPNAPPTPTPVLADPVHVPDLMKDAKLLDQLAIEKYGFEDLNQVGNTSTYTVNLDNQQNVVWGYGWCAKNETILRENLRTVSLQFAINGVRMSEQEFYVLERTIPVSLLKRPPPQNLWVRLLRFAEGWFSPTYVCNYLLAVLYAWPKGTTILESKAILDAPINDGYAAFPRGVITVVHNVTIR